MKNEERKSMGAAPIKNKTSSSTTTMLFFFFFCSHDPRATAVLETLKQGKDTSNIITAGEDEVSR